LNIVKRLTRRQRVARLDQKLLLKPQIKNLFCQRVDNLYRESEETKSYSKLEQAMELAAFTTLPKSSRSQPGWFSSNQTHLNRPIEERNSAVALKIRKPTRNSVRRLRKARKDLKTEISRSKNNWILNICRDINEPANGSKIYWDKVKLLRKGLYKPKVSSEKMMKKSDGSKCVNAEENAEVFREHFHKLYERKPIYDATVIELLEKQPVVEDLNHPPADSEVTKATQSLKNNAPGESGLTHLMFNALITCPETFTLVKGVILEFWNNENTPKQWDLGLLKMLPKKGDLSLPGNYRGIMLLEIAYKIVAKIVHQRLTPISESLDHETQCGFRPGRGCNDAIFAVKLALKRDVNIINKLGFSS